MNIIIPDNIGYLNSYNSDLDRYDPVGWLLKIFHIIDLKKETSRIINENLIYILSRRLKLETPLKIYELIDEIDRTSFNENEKRIEIFCEWLKNIGHRPMKGQR